MPDCYLKVFNGVKDISVKIKDTVRSQTFRRVSETAIDTQLGHTAIAIKLKNPMMGDEHIAMVTPAKVSMRPYT